MQRFERFVKNDVEENRNQYVAEHWARNRAISNQTQPYGVNVGAPSAANKKFRYEANNTEIVGTRNRSENNEPVSVKSYDSISTNYSKPFYMANKGFTPNTKEYVVSYNYQHNPSENNWSNKHVRRVCGNNDDSEHLTYTRNYDDFPIKCRNEDQLRNNTMIPVHKDGLSRHESQMGRNVGTFGPSDNGSTNNSRFLDNQRYNGAPSSNPEEVYNVNFSRNIIDETDHGDHQYRTSSLTKNRQQQHFGNVGPRDDPSKNSNEFFARYNSIDRKFQIGSTAAKQQLQKLDDGFVCVRNPEFFTELSTEVNDHYSRDIRRDKAQYKSSPISRNSRRKSQELILPRELRSRRSHSSSRSRKDYISREEQELRDRRLERRRKRLSSDDLRHELQYESQRNKYSKINTTQHKSQKQKLSRRKKAKANKINRLIDADLLVHSRHSATNRSATRIGRKIKSSVLESHAKKRSRNIKFPLSSQKSVKPLTPPPPSIHLSSTTDSKNIPLSAESVTRKIERENRQLQENPEIIMEPAARCLKPDPEKYWKEWWSKYAYVERVVKISDADVEVIKEQLKFRYDINKLNLDSKVNAVLNIGLSKIKLYSKITEKDYDHRFNVVETLKYIRILEDKDFQSFLLPQELKKLTKTLAKLNKNKILWALLHQSIICSWHNSMQTIKSELNGALSNKDPKVQKATALLDCKYFEYLVLDSIQKLKILTAEDWPGFDAFYNSLK